MSGALHDRVLALAGCFQAAALVRGVAREGGCAEDAFAATLASVLRLDAATVEAVYGGSAGLACGLEVLRRQLESGPERDPEITGYCVNLIFLEHRIMGDPARRERLRGALEALITRLGADPEPDEALVEALAGIYVEHVARGGPRILVRGEPRYLDQEVNARRIRALLLGGLRSTVLWRQLGGSRLGLLLRRAAYVRQAGVLLGTG